MYSNYLVDNVSKAGMDLVGGDRFFVQPLMSKPLLDHH